MEQDNKNISWDIIALKPNTSFIILLIVFGYKTLIIRIRLPNTVFLIKFWGKIPVFRLATKR